MVGYILILFYVLDAIFSLAFTPCVKYFGRIPIYSLAAVFNFVVLIVLIQVPAGGLTAPILTVVFWGIADAVWQTQING